MKSEEIINAFKQLISFTSKDERIEYEAQELAFSFLSEIDKEPESHKQNLQNYSAVNLLINRLRTHILQMTSMSPFGPYDLPPIDIADLYRQKSQLSAEKNA